MKLEDLYSLYVINQLGKQLNRLVGRSAGRWIGKKRNQEGKN